MVHGNQAVWDIYEKGYTVCVNQCESRGTIRKVKRYKPKNISELCAFIAAIRPAFKSMYSKFESREPFSYNIPALDKLLQTEELPMSYILYQEQTMTILNYAGFPMDQCYGIIKAIAKKHPEKVKPLKATFIEGFSKRIMEDEPGISKEDALSKTQEVWRIINDSCQYSFNSSHAYCVALDSLYCAWLKSHYPYEFYEVLLQMYSDKGKKDKVQLLKKEMQEAYGITEGSYKFGQDNRKFCADKANKQILPSLLSIKGFGQKTADELYEISHGKTYENFYEIWKALRDAKEIKKSHVEKLVYMEYFSDYGSINQILAFIEHAENLYGRNQFAKDKLPEQYRSLIEKYSESITEKQYRKFNYDAALTELLQSDSSVSIDAGELVLKQIETLGYALYRNPKADDRYGIIIDIDTKYSPKLTMYKVNTGETEIYKMKRVLFDKKDIKNGDFIMFSKSAKNKCKKQDGEWIQLPEQEYWITNLKRISVIA